MIPTKTGLFDHIHEILRLLKMSSTGLVAYQEKNRNVKIQRFTILIIYLFVVSLKTKFSQKKCS